jgi:hypothetical protein
MPSLPFLLMGAIEMGAIEDDRTGGITPLAEAREGP